MTKIPLHRAFKVFGAIEGEGALAEREYQTLLKGDRVVLNLGREPVVREIRGWRRRAPIFIPMEEGHDYIRVDGNEKIWQFVVHKSRVLGLA
jgi:hypothetical protein